MNGLPIMDGLRGALSRLAQSAALCFLCSLCGCGSEAPEQKSGAPKDATADASSPLQILGIADASVPDPIAGASSDEKSRNDPSQWMDGVDRIRLVDEGTRNGTPDRIDDCYLIDYGANDEIDRVVDWEDQDQDGVPDQLVLYTLTAELPGTMLRPEGTSVACWIIRQMDRDRNWWQLDRWQYQQQTCQFGSDFNGDSYFVGAAYVVSQGRWAALYEAPFCFFDEDGDGYSEEALRVESRDLTVRSIRWSFDSDDDGGSAQRPYDYDFSITARGSVDIDPSWADTIDLRGSPVRHLSYERARAWAGSATWSACLLVFDENDRNVDPDDPLDRERWEGVIASGVTSFPQAGGPGCGKLNKRYELRPSGGPIRLYWSEVDRRVHLEGAQVGSIEIDADEDGKNDAWLLIEDKDGDGRFDTWSYDADLVQGFEAVYTHSTAAYSEVPIDWERLRDADLRSARESGSLGQRERFFADVARWARTTAIADPHAENGSPHAATDWRP